MNATQTIDVRIGEDKVPAEIASNTTAGEVVAQIGRPDYNLVVNGATLGKKDVVSTRLTGKDEIRAIPSMQVG